MGGANGWLGGLEMSLPFVMSQWHTMQGDVRDFLEGKLGKNLMTLRSEN